MPKSKSLVIDTGPILSLVAATGDLKLLNLLYDRVLVPFEVCQELRQGGATGFGIKAFEKADWLKKKAMPLKLSPFLAKALDSGEAAVIQLALKEGISRVAIDEIAGRRMARLSGLALTGSVGILLRAKMEGHLPSLQSALIKSRKAGIWLSQSVIDFALREANEVED